MVKAYLYDIWVGALILGSFVAAGTGVVMVLRYAPWLAAAAVVITVCWELGYSYKLAKKDGVKRGW